MVYKRNSEKGTERWKGQKYLPCSQSRRGPDYQGLYIKASMLVLYLFDLDECIKVV